MSLNADLERDDVSKAAGALDELKAGLLKNGLDADTFHRLKQAAIARQAWAVQGNSALADYYWSALGDYEDGRFSDPARELRSVTLAQANKAMRELLMQPGYLRVEKPLLGDDQLIVAIAAVLGLLVLVLLLWCWRTRKTAQDRLATRTRGR